MNLNELFLTHKGTRSYDDLARQCGGALTSQRLQQIATTTPAEFPKPKNIQAISRALGVTEVVVVLAAAESLGLDVARQLPKLVQVLPAAASDLSDEEAAAIAHVIRAFKREDVMGNAEHPAATKAAEPELPEQAGPQLRAVAHGGGVDEALAAEADRLAHEARAEQMRNIKEMERKKRGKGKE